MALQAKTMRVFLVVSVLLTASRSVAAQERRWFLEAGYGRAAVLNQSEAWNGGGHAHTAFGMVINPSLAVSIAWDIDNLGYDRFRLNSLFPNDPVTRTSISGELITVTAGLEWSAQGRWNLRPSVGAGITYLQREVGGFALDPAWHRCVLDSGNQDGCAEFREDLQVDGEGFGLEGSAGLDMVFPRQDIGFRVRIVKGVVGQTSGIFSSQVRYRIYF